MKLAMNFQVSLSSLRSSALWQLGSDSGIGLVLGIRRLSRFGIDQSNISAIEHKSEYRQLFTAEQNSLDSLIKKQWQCNLHIESMWRQKSRQI